MYNHFVGEVIKRKLRERRKKKKDTSSKTTIFFFPSCFHFYFFNNKRNKKILMTKVQKRRMTLKARETSNDHSSYSSTYKENLGKVRKEQRKESKPNPTGKKNKAFEDPRKK